MGERVLFKRGEQRKFLELVRDELNCSSVRGILQFGFDVPYSTLKNYYAESNILPRELFEDLCYLSKIDKNSLNFKIVNDNWGRVLGGKRGIKTLMEKYPEKIKYWRKMGQRNSPILKEGFNIKPILIPKLNEKLAEFIGAYLGDGTITKYQIRISGDYRYDIPYYRYLSEIIFELFGITAHISKEKDKNTSALTISSKLLCSFLNREYCIKFGDKIRNKAKIPRAILNDRVLSIACLRGLIDTDGSISRRGRNGSQFCIQFSSHNPYLLSQVCKLGKKLGIFTFCDKTGAGTNKWANIEKYFKIVGSSNLRHIVRFYLRKFENKTIYQNEVKDYYKQSLYKDMTLPFKI